jgi:sugar O-acyltransferase (sialic acid O-acetyltransferase NeuD family)
LSTLLVLGAGGHGRVVADAALRAGVWQGLSATDRDTARCFGELLPGVRLAAAATVLPSATAVHIAIGDAQFRQAEARAVGADKLATVTHPDASLSAYAQVGAGCFLAARSVVAPCARLGACVIVNHGAVVDHDVEVGDFSHVAPNVTLGGGARVGSRVLVGAGTAVLPGVSICDDTVIGAGSVVTENIAEPGVYAGVPARRVR